MIHYHGGPISDLETAVAVWRGRHALVSFARPEQLKLAAEISQSFCLDNGAFSAWKRGLRIDWEKYFDWVDEWRRHPGFDFAIIPDVIDGDEAANDELVYRWCRRYKEPGVGVPVWHMHESLDRLETLAFKWPATSLWRFPRVAIGSSGPYSAVGTERWWQRMREAMELLFVKDHTLYGLTPVPHVPPPKIHGLRMLNPRIFSQLPLSSADSTHIARAVQYDNQWKGTYQPASKRVRGIVLADRIESFNSAAGWPVLGDGAVQLHPASLQHEMFDGLEVGCG